MLKVSFDAESLQKQLGERTEAVLQRSVDVLGEQARAGILKATDGLPAAQQKIYKQALLSERRETSVMLVLKGEAANKMETDQGQIDMKPALLRSKKAKITKDGQGRYIDIPFQHRTTKRGKGTQVPTSMRAMVEKATRSALSEGVRTRLFKNKSSHQGDMVVRPLDTGGAQATTMRRVSKNSKPSSWLLKGAEGLKAFEKTMMEVAKTKDAVIAGIARKMGA